jgi:hypothetical protein
MIGRQMSDAGIARLWAEMHGLPGKEPGTGREDRTRSCVEPGCKYPAVVGEKCGYHQGREINERRAALRGAGRRT